MCRPSLDPGGVSSAAEADALADADADCEGESRVDGAWRLGQPLDVNGLLYETVAEPLLVTELADAEMLGVC